MTIILTAIIPIFLIIILGAFSQKKNLLGDNSVQVLNRFVFYFSFPPFLFVIMAEEPIATILNWPYIAALITSIFGTFILVLIFSKYFMQGSLAIKSIRAQAAAFPNIGYIGLPLVIPMFGAKAALPIGIGIILVMLVFIISIMLIEIECHRGRGIWHVFYQVSISLFKNPLVVSPVIGILYSALDLPLPIFLQHFCHQIGAAAAPCALFAIGANLASQKIQPRWREVITVNFFKLILQPLLALIAMWVFKVSPLWAMAGVVGMSTSTAATAFITAQQYKIYHEDAASVIFYGAVGSVITIPIFALLVRYLWSA